MKKVFTTLTIALAAFCFTFGGVKEVSAKNSDTSALNPVDNLSKEISQKYDKAPIKSEVYLKIVTDNSGKNDAKIEEHTREQYIKDSINESLTPKTRAAGDPITGASQTNWIRLSIEAYKTSSSSYDVYGFYSWLSHNFYVGTDYFALCSDGTNTSFKESGSYATHYREQDNGSIKVITDKSLESRLGGIFAKVTPVGKLPYGLMYCKNVKANSGAIQPEIAVSYSHQNMPTGVTPSVSLPGVQGLSVSPSAMFSDHTKRINIFY